MDNPDTNPDSMRPLDELQLLKERATQMGISFGPNIKVETLRERIQDKLSGKMEAEAAARPKDGIPQTPKGSITPVPGSMTKQQREQQIRQRVQREAMALVRCRIYNLNPSKNDLRGEIITVANKYLGTVRKFIPFGEQTDGGYHIPKVIYNHLLSRKFQQIRTTTVRGQIKVDTRLVPEYSIEVLPQLTKDELEELAIRQAAAERLGSD